MGCLQNISVIIPSFHSKELLKICVKSISKFCPNNYKFEYVIIENSKEVLEL